LFVVWILIVVGDWQSCAIQILENWFFELMKTI
jgi:hypothetical protein